MAFQGKQPNPSIAKICIEKSAEFHFLIQGAEVQNKKIQHPVSWTKPDLDGLNLTHMHLFCYPQTVQVRVDL